MANFVEVVLRKSITKNGGRRGKQCGEVDEEVFRLLEQGSPAGIGRGNLGLDTIHSILHLLPELTNHSCSYSDAQVYPCLHHPRRGALAFDKRPRRAYSSASVAESSVGARQGAKTSASVNILTPI